MNGDLSNSIFLKHLPLIVLAACTLASMGSPANAEIFFRGHPWCERPIVSGAAKGGLGYRYNMDPPHRVRSVLHNNSVDALQFLLQQLEVGTQHTPVHKRGDDYEMHAIINYHRQGFSHSIQSPFVSVTSRADKAEGYANDHHEYSHPEYPGEVLVIDVPDNFVCDRERWESIISSVLQSTGRRLNTPDHPVFKRCKVLQFPDSETHQWVFVHNIPSNYITSSYPYPNMGDHFRNNCDIGPEDDDDDGDDGVFPESESSRSGKLRGKKSTSRKGASSSSYLKGNKLKLGKLEVDLDTLFKTAAEYLKGQMQAALKAQADQIQGEFVAQAEGVVQEIYDDFLYWLNATVHTELLPDKPIDSQAFETEFLNWINSPDAQLKKYIEQYLRQESDTIGWLLDTYKDVQSWKLADGVKEIWSDASTKFNRFTEAVEEAEGDPDTAYADTLAKYGFSGEWIDKFKSYEGKFNTFNEKYKIVEAGEIMVGAFQSDIERDKISALFHLMDLMGTTAEESRIPIVSLFGQIVGEYGRIALQMLERVNALAELIRERHGYCLGEGVTEDKRNKAYYSQFGPEPGEPGTVICPTLLSEDIYERVVPSDYRMYFWVKDKFIEGNEFGGGISAVRQAISLTRKAAKYGLYNYVGKEGDVELMAKIYNTDYETRHGRGIEGLLNEADKTIDGIARRYKAIEGKFTLAGNNICRESDIRKYLRETYELDYTRFRASDENDERETLEKLKTLFALSYIEKRRDRAYGRYAKIWKDIRNLSVLRLHGDVKDEAQPDKPCSKCSNINVDIEARGALQPQSCNITRADRNGDFIAYMLIDTLEFSIDVSARVGKKTSEKLLINKDALSLDYIPFEDDYYFDILMPFEKTEEVRAAVPVLKLVRTAPGDQSGAGISMTASNPVIALTLAEQLRRMSFMPKDSDSWPEGAWEDLSRQERKTMQSIKVVDFPKEIVLDKPFSFTFEIIRREGWMGAHECIVNRSSISKEKLESARGPKLRVRTTSNNFYEIYKSLPDPGDETGSFLISLTGDKLFVPLCEDAPYYKKDCSKGTGTCLQVPFEKQGSSGVTLSFEPSGLKDEYYDYIVSAESDQQVTEKKGRKVRISASETDENGFCSAPADECNTVFNIGTDLDDGTHKDVWFYYEQIREGDGFIESPQIYSHPAGFDDPLLRGEIKRKAVVPDVIGMIIDEAEKTLTDAKLKIESDQGTAAETPGDSGRVEKQHPSPGTEVSFDSSVRVTFFAPYPKKIVPDVMGMKLDDAKIIIRREMLWINVETADRTPSSDKQDTVLSQAPAAGTKVDHDSVVTLTVYPAYTEQLTVPDLVGKSQFLAIAWLEELGLRVMLRGGGTARTPEEVGHVAEQSPSAGSSVGAGSTVTLTTYDQSVVVVPDLVGRSEEFATFLLEELGLVPGVEMGSAAPSRIEGGKVASQSVTPGTTVPRRTLVTLAVYGAFVSETEIAGSSPSDCMQWPGTVLQADPVSGEFSCQCPSGSAWSSVQNRCLGLPGAGGGGGTVVASACSHMPGTLLDSISGQCRCPVGSWHTAQRKCVDVAAEERQRDIAAGEKEADCEMLYSEIRIFRSHPSAIHRDAATASERTARAMGCDAARISEAIAQGGEFGGGDVPAPGTGTPPTSTGTSGTSTTATSTSGTGTAGPGTARTGTTKTGTAGTGTGGTGTAGTGKTGTGKTGTGKTGTGKTGTGTTGTSGSEEVPCECTDPKGRRYAIMFGQFGTIKCGDEAEAHRNYNCTDPKK